MDFDITTYAIIYFASLFVGFILIVCITREIFHIPRMLRYQKAQIKLLEEIAKVNGVDSAQVKKIVSAGIIEWEPADKEWTTTG